MTTIYVCPCCNRSIYHPPPCRKFEEQREADQARMDRLGYWLSRALGVGLVLAAWALS